MENPAVGGSAESCVTGRRRLGTVDKIGEGGMFFPRGRDNRAVLRIFVLLLLRRQYLPEIGWKFDLISDIGRKIDALRSVSVEIHRRDIPVAVSKHLSEVRVDKSRERSNSG